MRNKLFFIFLVCILIFSGCLRSRNDSQPKKPKVYVEPCNIAIDGMSVRVDSNSLNAQTIRNKLVSVFIDDFSLPSSSYMWDSYTLNCYWGHNIDEKVDRYYCNGKYKAPESDETNTIKRLVWKEFKIGFDIRTHDLEKQKVHYLTVRSVDGNCYIAD